MKKTSVTVAAIVSILIYGGYKLFAVPLDSRMDPRLVHAFNEISKASEETGQRSIQIIGPEVEPVEVSEDISGKVLDILDSANVKSVYFSKDERGDYSTALYVNVWLSFISPRWYYLYSSDDRLEEEVVPSIREALASDKYPYHYCEKADIDHWYFCTAGDL